MSVNRNAEQKVNDSNTPTTLQIPTLSRTGTGNSSIASTASSSQNSTTGRRWNLTSWFSHQQQQQQQQLEHEQLKKSIRRQDDTEASSIGTLSPQITGPTTDKRYKVIQELLETEKAYQRDMGLLKEIYYDGAHHAGLTKLDIRHLFSNLIEIVEFEHTFVALLESSCEQDSVGTAFRETVKL